MSDTETQGVVPNLRQIAVAKAYVQGLESDRIRLHVLEETINSQIWDIVQFGSYVRAFQRLVARMLHDREHGQYTVELDEWAYVLLADSKLLYDQAFPCPCGHSKWDHDEDGCLFIGCKKICGVTERS